MLKGLAVNALTAVASAGLAAGAGMVGFVKDSVSAAGNFEASVNGLAAVAGDALGNAGISLEDVSDKALQLGKDTQFSAQEAIQAMTELAKGGVPIVSVMTDATDATLALAAAAGVPLANAAEIVAKQLGVWGETGVTAAEVTDLIASAANASTVGVEDLALGLAQAGGTAKTAGVKFDDLVQTMALIAPNFSSASDAGTSLKTMLSRLIPTTDPAKAAMAELGLYTAEAGSAFFDATGSFIGMEAAAGLLQTATAGLSEEQKLLAFNTIFGSDAIRAAAAIANAGAPGFANMGQAMADTGGAAAAAAIKQQGFAFAMEQLSGSIETLQIVIGTKLLPIITPLIGQFTAGVNAALEFATAMSAADDPVAFLTTQFPPLQAALALAQTAFQTISAVIAVVMPAIVGVVQSGLAILAAFWQAHGAEIVAFVTTTWATIQSIVTTALQIVWSILQPMLTAWTEGVNTHGTAIQGILTNVWEIISSVITAALAIIQGVLQAALAVMRGDWQGAWEAIQAMSVTVTQALGTIIFAFLDSIALAMGNTWDTIASQVTAGWGYVVENTTRGVQLVLAAVQELVSQAGQIGGAFISGIASGITGALGGLVSAARNAAQAAVNAARAALNIHSPSQVMAVQVGKPFAEGMAKGITDNIGLAITAAGGLAKAAVDGARAALMAPSIEAGGGGGGGRGAPALSADQVRGAFGRGGAMPGGGGSTRTTTNNFAMHISTNAAASTVASDFAMMRALAGAS